MFYITLPSNSSLTFYPDNNASHFVTKLPQTQELDGDYEVGLAEIQYSNSYQNVLKDEVYFDYEVKDKPLDTKNIIGLKHEKRVNVPEGLYESNKYFVAVLNRLATSTLSDFAKPKTKPVLKFYYNQATRRVSITRYQERSALRLSPALSAILGTGKKEKVLSGSAKFFASPRPMDLDQNVKSIFVYSDLVRMRPVGDVVVPLLRSVPVDNKEKDTVHYTFEKPHYIPLARFRFDTVEILLTSDKGHQIPFDNGHTIVTLHFRRRRL